MVRLKMYQTKKLSTALTVALLFFSPNFLLFLSSMRDYFFIFEVYNFAIIFLFCRGILNINIKHEQELEQYLIKRKKDE
jgi:hypothetical protein